MGQAIGKKNAAISVGDKDVRDSAKKARGSYSFSVNLPLRMHLEGVGDVRQYAFNRRAAWHTLQRRGHVMRALFIGIAIVTILLFTALFLPVTLRLRVEISRSKREFRYRVGVIGGRIHRNFEITPRDFDFMQKEAERRGSRNLFHLTRDVLKRVSFWQIDAFFLLGTGDAAATALCCGVLDATLNAVGAVFLPRGKKGRGFLSRTTPSFGAPALEAQFHGIFRFRLAQIIIAALAWRNATNKERHA
jgi:hypothetical protein